MAKFVKTPKQREALALANAHRHTLLFGGARSGKTTIFVRNVFLRAVKKPSRHLMVRFRFNHARTSLGHETVPKVLELCFPGLDVKYNGTDHYWEVPTICGNVSQVWLGGIDDKERADKILGNEYSTIYANECSQIAWDTITTLWSRLAEGGKEAGPWQKFYYDCNPTGKKHWTNLVFNEGVLPDGEPCALDTVVTRINPTDNLDNLAPEYIDQLKALPKRQRQRFLDGLYLTDVEGALWTDQMVNQAKAKETDLLGLRKTVVAVDPSVTNNPGSDECGIVVCSLDHAREGVVHDDVSGKFSTETWARRVVNIYDRYGANYVVAEVNNGGDLVENVIHNIDPNVKVVKVRAAVGKFARAEPVSQLYEQGKVCHLKELPDLEAELTETVFDDLDSSPNRLDALVWGLTDLMIGSSGSKVHVG